MLSAGGVLASGDITRGAELAADCADCHGEDGKGDEEVPGIAGMEAEKLAKLLADFKSGAVESEMVDFVGDINEQDMADIAAFYASLPN
jgi:cytochrome c553